MLSGCVGGPESDRMKKTDRQSGDRFGVGGCIDPEHRSSECGGTEGSRVFPEIIDGDCGSHRVGQQEGLSVVRQTKILQALQEGPEVTGIFIKAIDLPDPRLLRQ